MEPSPTKRLFVDLCISEVQGIAANFTRDSLVAAQCTLDGIQARTPYASMVQHPGSGTYLPVWDEGNGKMSWELSEQMVARLIHHSPRFKVQLFTNNASAHASEKSRAEHVLLGFTVHDFRTILQSDDQNEKATEGNASRSQDGARCWSKWCALHAEGLQGSSKGQLRVTFTLRWSDSLEREQLEHWKLQVPGAVPDGDHIRIGSQCHDAHTFTLSITLLRTSDLTKLFSKPTLADCRRKGMLFFLAYSLFDVDICSNAFSGLITPHLDCIRDTFKLRGSLDDVAQFLRAAPLVVHVYGCPKSEINSALLNPRSRKPFASAVVDFDSLCDNLVGVDQTRMISANASGAYPFANHYVLKMEERMQQESLAASKSSYSSVAVDLSLAVEDPGTPTGHTEGSTNQQQQQGSVADSNIIQTELGLEELTFRSTELQGTHQSPMCFEVILGGTALGTNNPALQVITTVPSVDGKVSYSAVNPRVASIGFRAPEEEGQLIIQCRSSNSAGNADGPVLARAVVNLFQVLPEVSLGSSHRVVVNLYSTSSNNVGDVCGNVVLAIRVIHLPSKFKEVQSRNPVGTALDVQTDQWTTEATSKSKQVPDAAHETINVGSDQEILNDGANPSLDHNNQSAAPQATQSGQDTDYENDGDFDDERSETRSEQVVLNAEDDSQTHTLQEPVRSDDQVLGSQLEQADSITNVEVATDDVDHFPPTDKVSWGNSTMTHHIELSVILKTIRGLAENTNIYVQYHSPIAGTKLVRSQPPILVNKHSERKLPTNGSLQVVFNIPFSDFVHHLQTSSPLSVQVWHRDRYLEDQQIGICAVPLLDVLEQPAKFRCGERVFYSLDSAQEWIRDRMQEEQYEAQASLDDTPQAARRTAERASARLRRQATQKVIRVQEITKSLPVSSFDAKPLPSGRPHKLRNMVKNEAFISLTIRVEDHGEPTLGEDARPRHVVSGIQVRKNSNMKKLKTQPASTDRVTETATHTQDSARKQVGYEEASSAIQETELLLAKRDFEHRVEVEELTMKVKQQDELIHKLRSENEAQLAYFEKNWAIREFERINQVEEAKKEYDQLHERLRRALQDAERRERAVRAMEVELKTSHERKVAETDILMRRLREDNLHKLQLHKERTAALEHRLRHANEQLAKCQQQVKRVEDDFASFREEVRRSPEAKLQQRVSELNGKLQGQKLELEQERHRRETEIHEKEKMRARLFQLARELQRYKEEESKGAQRQLEKLKLEYLAREEQFMLGGEREELRSIKAEMESLRIAAARQEFMSGRGIPSMLPRQIPPPPVATQYEQTGPLNTSNRSNDSEGSSTCSETENPVVDSPSGLSGIQGAAAQDLKRLLAEREELKQSLGSSHPIMLQLQRHINAARQVLVGR